MVASQPHSLRLGDEAELVTKATLGATPNSNRKSFTSCHTSGLRCATHPYTTLSFCRFSSTCPSHPNIPPHSTRSHPMHHVQLHFSEVLHRPWSKFGLPSSEILVGFRFLVATMAQCTMQMRAVTSWSDVVGCSSKAAGRRGENVAAGIVGASRLLASASQGWRSLNVAQLRVAAAGRVESQREHNLVAGRVFFFTIRD